MKMEIYKVEEMLQKNIISEVHWHETEDNRFPCCGINLISNIPGVILITFFCKFHEFYMVKKVQPG